MPTTGTQGPGNPVQECTASTENGEKFWANGGEKFAGSGLLDRCRRVPRSLPCRLHLITYRHMGFSRLTVRFGRLVRNSAAPTNTAAYRTPLMKAKQCSTCSSEPCLNSLTPMCAETEADQFSRSIPIRAILHDRGKLSSNKSGGLSGLVNEMLTAIPRAALLCIAQLF